MGNAASELQHVANALTGMLPEEKKFLEAVYEGKVQEARALLKSNPNVIYARTREWDNAWHAAAVSGNLEMLDVLHKYGRGGSRKPLPGEPTPVNHKNKKGVSPLMVAVKAGHLEAMQYMLSFGAELRSQDIYGNTCVHYAALGGHTKVLEILLANAEAEWDGTEGTNAAANAAAAVVSTAATVVALGAAANSGMGVMAKGRFVDLVNEAGLMPLHFAVWGGKLDAAKVLRSHNAQLVVRTVLDSTAEVTCNGGSTPLHVAALRNNVAMVKFLLDEYVREKGKGSLPKDTQDMRLVRDNYGFTPQQLASNLKRVDVVPLLDPKAKLTSYDEMMRSATFTRMASLRRTTNNGAGSHEESTSDYIKRVSGVGGAPGTSVQHAPSAVVQEDWDPFGTGETFQSATPAPKSSTSSPGESKASSSQPANSSQPASSPPPAPSTSSAVPPDFMCPITHNMMTEPVVAADGRSYEKSAIEMWLALGNAEFPGTTTKVTSKELKPNTDLCERIAAWKLSSGSRG
mmetsp:Transcript_36791/g.81832  ORF Transcript_36791/g.81832 Transcript_36791/m.81832 type:complete len:516 (-) Transcript_36791:2973-4520(-)